MLISSEEQPFWDSAFTNALTGVVLRGAPGEDSCDFFIEEAEKIANAAVTRRREVLRKRKRGKPS